MTRHVFLFCLALPAAAFSVDFNRDVRPVLAQHCFKCHGMDEAGRKGKLRLDLRDSAIGQGKSGELAIVPGKPDASEVIKRVFSTDEDEVMPPPHTKSVLPESAKNILKAWIAEGAPYEAHWAYVPPKQAVLPVAGVHPIDSFIQDRLKRESFQSSAEADRYTLVRRVYLDLTGLPPTPAEADAFVNDKSPNAYDKLVDALLASKPYGERWARRWLDLARYADTNGFEKDRPRQIWPYRDWVVRALNNDMPFDQFSIKQIAGDMLPHPTPDDLIATGFHRNT
ncbi:MAG: Planctomycete cytochrome, partial [Prosthecobacter sp.]|nr:Planctomycete cytochrome [Prosthecobacter sp.]